ncbi:MAG: FtsQ-type POTRA domain-containing protein [Desulfosalsimonadaceae bacterium]
MAAKSRRKNRYAGAGKSESAENGRSIRWWLSGALWAGAAVTVMAAMSLVCIFSYDWITQCSYFRARTIEVAGCSRLDPEMIKEIAGAREGTNIFSVNLASARKRLIADPWIKEAGIQRGFPPKMKIDVCEHEALAVMDFGRRFLIDADGNIFKEYGSSDPEGLPVISGVAYKDWAAGNARESKVFHSVMEILQLGKREESVIPNHNIETIIVDKEIGLSLKIREPATMVELGFDAYEKKLERLSAIAVHLEGTALGEAFSRVDLKNPDRVVARPVNEMNVVAGKGGSSEGT